jgi:hypothetical protein
MGTGRDNEQVTNCYPGPFQVLDRHDRFCTPEPGTLYPLYNIPEALIHRWEVPAWSKTSSVTQNPLKGLTILPTPSKDPFAFRFTSGPTTSSGALSRAHHTRIADRSRGSLGIPKSTSRQFKSALGSERPNGQGLSTLHSSSTRRDSYAASIQPNKDLWVLLTDPVTMSC